MLKRMKTKKTHEPVLVEEVIELLGLEKFAHSNKRGKVIDATVGLGGHSLRILEFNIDILGLDVDQAMLDLARDKLTKAYPPLLKHKKGSFSLVRANFKDIDTVAEKEGFVGCDAILFDLGISSVQLTSPLRGFSFGYPNSDLDMRIDRKTSKLSAADLVNLLSQKQLVNLFLPVLDKGLSRKVAKAIVEARRQCRITSVDDLLKTLAKVMKKKGKTHPATKIFLALRIAVNSELDNIKIALPKAFFLLKKKGRLAVISFHSLEDRIVKNYFDRQVASKLARDLTASPIRPKTAEVVKNPSARSALLRVIEKI
jgi:16S rRNA (cytosine1402-N4)-methyltransferase